MRYFVFSVPHNPSHVDFTCCAFAQKARKLCSMLKMQGHTVIHFGNELSDVECDEHVTVTTKDELMNAYPDCQKLLGHVDYHDNNNAEAKQYLNAMYTLKCEYEAKQRHEKGDYFCYVVPTIQKELYGKLFSLPVHSVESGIGYFGAYMPYKIFESPAVQSWHYGYYASSFDRYNALSETEKESYPYDANTHRAVYDTPQFDAVIPNSFDVDQFDFRVNKDDYFLFLGRVIDQKGVKSAVEICKRLGKKLIIAGPGDYEKEIGEKLPSNVELFGPATPEERRELLSKARALFCISKYWEPFGGVHIEAMLSGTPPIASNKGVFQITIRPGYNGYRLGMNEVEEGVWAANNIDKIDPYDLRDFGLRFSNEQISLKYDHYFQSLDAAIKNGGDIYGIENNDRDDLDWIDYDRKIEWPEGWMTPVDSP